MTTSGRIASSRRVSNWRGGFGSLNQVFIGLMLAFTRNLHPQSTAQNGQNRTETGRDVGPASVKLGTSIASGATSSCGIEIGGWLTIEAVSLVTREVLPHAEISTSPARLPDPLVGNF